MWALRFLPAARKRLSRSRVAGSIVITLMKISEIFYSIQGEGMLLGVPSVFVRTSGCNLRCTWCDTPYTSWNPEGEQFTVKQVVEKVAQFPASHVVVTGGEPMIAPEIGALTSALHDRQMHITI